MIRATLLLLSVLGFPALGSPAQAAERCVTDDAGRDVCLGAPAERVVALSPGATELLFAAGAGEAVVAAVSHADYPEAAQELPRVGSYDRLDLESIVARRPDLVVGWISGNPGAQLERVEELGFALYLSEPRSLDDVASTVERLGRLAGTDAAAQEAAAEFRRRRAELEDAHADREPIRVFYQVWPDPLITVNNEQIISESIRLCGGVNVFGDSASLTPRLDRESVLAADPEAIVAGGMGDSDRSWLDGWRRFDGMTAVARDNLFFVEPSTIQRPTPRILVGTETLCEKLEKARARR